MGTDPFAFLLGKESKDYAISSATQLVNAWLDRNVHVFELTVGWWCLSDSVAWDRRRETSGCPSLWLQRRKDWHLRVLHLIPKPWHFKTRQNDGHPLLIEPKMLRIFQRRSVGLSGIFGSLHPYCSTVTFPSLLVWYQTLSNLNIIDCIICDPLCRLIRFLFLEDRNPQKMQQDSQNTPNRSGCFSFRFQDIYL